MPDYSLRQLTVEEIARRCRQEAQRKREQELGYCFELFRRALEGQDQLAWRAIQEQYRALVLGWLHTAAGKRLALEEVEDLLQNTLERFWRSLSRRPQPVADHFAHVGALLKYLHQCAVTSLLDARRQARKRELVRQALAAGLDVSQHMAGSDSIAEPGNPDQLQQLEQLQKVQEWLRTEVGDDLDRLVLQLSYEQDLKPAEIAARYPNLFSSTQEVYRIKERVLKRARRALLA
ncbi:MAG: sigma-70 family RNA polymerase sigma factor [Chloroflexi bacterium]|nr:sigma-70 family RNA polymerase sigma factor [Chloroflexota bacterium]MCI0644365.1 sigma-70 family RNA polymerase sigma factor [Chloroflexota bacterium]